MKRRDLLKGAVASTLAAYAPRLLKAQQPVTKLTDNLAVIDGGGANITAFSAGQDFVLVDSGVSGSGDAIVAALKGLVPNGKVQTLFNTHYHLDQTANNEQFAAQGAKIIAQMRTREWMRVDYWDRRNSVISRLGPRPHCPPRPFETKRR